MTKLLKEKVNEVVELYFKGHDLKDIISSIEVVDEYALYKGDNLIAIGTLGELADKTGYSHETLKRFKTPYYRRTTGENSSALIRLQYIDIVKEV